MTCEACGKEITGSYVCFKKVGSQEYMSFHSDTEAPAPFPAGESG